MAKVWMVKEGSDPARGGPWRAMPLAECREKLGLKQSDFHCGLTTIPKFGDKSKPPAKFRDPVVVVVQIDNDEATEHQWQAGFYVLDISPKEAEKRCVPSTGQ
jgi:hypothetical protein